MPSYLLALLLAACGSALRSDAVAQQAPQSPPTRPITAPAPQRPASNAPGAAQTPQTPPPDPLAVQQMPTPPISPNVVETPIPTPVPAPTVPLPSDVPNRPLTADEAALIALHHQPNVTIAQAGIAAAQGRVQQVQSSLLPNVTLNGSYTHIESLSGSGGGASGGGSTGSGAGGTTTPSGSRAATVSGGFVGTATLRQLIFDFNHTRDLVREAVNLEHAATQNLNAVEANTVFQVKQAFYLYAQNIHLVGVNQADLQNRQAQLALARARLNSGLGLPSDVVTAETAVAQAAIGLSVAQNNASVSRVNLALLMGIDPRTPIVVADTTNEPPFASNDVNALVTTALRQRPEILQAQATIQANRDAVSAARTTNTPVLSGSLQVQSAGDQFLPQNNSFSVGAAITFTPFDGGLTAGLVKEARANLAASQAALVATQQTVASDVTQSYLNLRSAEQRVVTANAEVANATEGVRIAQGRYQSGLGLFQDIITAQGFLVTANTDLVNAQTAVDQARAALQRAIGSPLPIPPGR